MGTRRSDDLANLSLAELLIGAAEAPPNARMEFRDAIAAHGAEAVAALEPWLINPDLAAFAVRTIAKAADVDPAAASAALQRGLSASISPTTRRDIEDAIGRLGGRLPRSTPSRTRAKGPPTVPTGSPGDLVCGRVYRRRAELHPLLGGNQQKGISYPANAAYVLLFSDPRKVSDLGYNDRWDGNAAYWYFGEWDGPGDMTMTGGNAVIVDRSPHLHLFIAASGGHRYEGQFRYDCHKSERATRDGRDFGAIVFHLVRVSS